MRAFAFLVALLVCSSPAQAGPGLGMSIDRIAPSFNSIAKDKGWDVRLIQQGCSVEKGQASCQYYVTDGLVAVANSVQDGTEAQTFALVLNKPSERPQLVRAIGATFSALVPELDDAESKAAISALFQSFSSSTNGRGSIDLRGLEVTGSMASGLGAFFVTIERP